MRVPARGRPLRAGKAMQERQRLLKQAAGALAHQVLLLCAGVLFRPPLYERCES